MATKRKVPVTSLLHASSSYTPYNDLPYGDASPNQKLDLRVPNNGFASNPLLVFFHGGGWLSGDEAFACIPFDKAFTNRGFAVASVRYRLDSEAIWPAQLEDAKAAIRYLRAHAGPFRLFAPKIGVWGTSAGGHLALMCCATNGVDKFDVGSYPHTSSDVAVGMIDYGISDLPGWASAGAPYSNQNPSPTAMVTGLLGGPPATVPDLAADASPMTWIDPGCAPAAFLHGGNDQLVPTSQSTTPSNLLKSLGIVSNYTIVPTKGHADLSMYSSGWLDNVSAMFDYYLQP